MPKFMSIKDMQRLVKPAKYYYSLTPQGRAKIHAQRIENAMMVWGD